MFWTFSWSPLRDESGAVAGALHPAVETTGHVLAERRMALLRDLATSVGQATGVRDACERAVAVLEDHPRDTPLSAVYLLDEVPGPGVPVAARLAAAGGARDVAAVFPVEVDLTEAAYTPWPLPAAAASRQPGGAWAALALDPAWLLRDPAPTTGVVLPLRRPGGAHPLALLALGLDPRRPVDASQTSFLQLLAGQLSTAGHGGSPRAAVPRRRRPAALAAAGHLPRDGLAARRRAIPARRQRHDGRWRLVRRGAARSRTHRPRHR